jgi:hypothetical protein
LWLYGSAAKPNIPFLANHALLVAVFVLAFKKGYIIIEVAEEQEGKDQEENQDYNI